MSDILVAHADCDGDVTLYAVFKRLYTYLQKKLAIVIIYTKTLWVMSQNVTAVFSVPKNVT